jgi:hypothetical protein
MNRKPRAYCLERKATRSSIASSLAQDLMVSVPQRSRLFASLAPPARRRSAHRHKFLTEALTRAVTGDTKEASRQRTTGFLQGELAISAAWPGTLPFAHNQGCAELARRPRDAWMARRGQRAFAHFVRPQI